MSDTVDPCWLLVLGSNADDASDRLDAARGELASLGDIVRQSLRLDGEDVQQRGPRYVNQLLLLRTGIDVGSLRAELKRIEARHGRNREAAGGAICALDIDLLARVERDTPQWLDDKPLKIPAVVALLTTFGFAAG